MYFFHNDYNEACHPQVAQKLSNCSSQQMPGYGVDECCERAAGLIRNLCGSENLSVHFLVGGTQQGGYYMADTIEERACELAVYMIETGATVRTTAQHFGISKSTVHKDLSQRLPQCNRTLYVQVRQILDENKAQRHIRGGMATKRKYQQEKLVK